MSANVIAERLSQLRQYMHQANIDVLLVPSADPHMSEYLPEYWQVRRYFSGFTGSVGVLIIGGDFAQLWTDTRYWIQADAQLAGTGIQLCKMQRHQPSYIDFLASLPQGTKVGVDGMVLSVYEFEQLSERFEKQGIELVLSDVAGLVWQSRPALSDEPVYCHDKAFVAQSSADKLNHVRQAMQAQQADYHLMSSLDDIAWLTNLRGQDVPCNPVFLAHLLITPTQATLYINRTKLSDEVMAQLAQAGIDVAEYEAVQTDLTKLTGVLWIDEHKVAQGVIAKLSLQAHLFKAPNPSTQLKAVKSPQELTHIRQAMGQDGAALCEFFADLEERLSQGEQVSEVDIDSLLTQARAKQAYYISPSFDTIAGFGGNGAIVHYRAETATCKYLIGDGLLLIDSGAQYQNGTTDITRMMGVGQISDDAKRDVSYVLKAHIALARAVFPAHLAAPMLDVIARTPMWAAQLDYGHGTGHGVGYFLNVHEDPQRIAYSATINDEQTMQLGMVTSNEPGLYRTNQWGVRIENLVATVPCASNEFGEFWAFETLTLCPIDTRIILPKLLNDDEKAWLNAYHAKVREQLIERVHGKAKAWLIERTQPI